MSVPKKAIPILLLAVLAVTACTTSYDDLAKRRAEKAKRATGDIRIALVWQENIFKSYFYEGAELATDEINRGGGILGRKIRTVRYNNQSVTIEKDLKLAKQIAADDDYVAVVGHYLGIGAIEASVTYEYSGIVFMAVTSISSFSEHGFKYVFRNVLSDRVTGIQLADFAKKRGFSNILVIDDRTVYGKGLADAFHERASKIGINVVARRTYNERGTDFKPLFAEIRGLRFDAIFLGGSIPTAADVIKQARLMGVTVPFIGGDGLDSPTFWDMAGKAAEGTIIPTAFHHDEKHPAAKAFSTAFCARYHAYPDTWSAHGYDAIRTLAAAMKQAGTTVPVVVASHLRFLDNWQGALGDYSFTKEGDVSGDINEFQVLHNGTYELLEGGQP
jgi:branched-chain amino acid transport system substrate-binding protein